MTAPRLVRWLLLLALVVPILLLIIGGRGRSVDLEPKTDELKAMKDLLKALNEREKQAYQSCRSEALKRSYRFAVQVATLDYVSRANLAMQVELVLSVRLGDLRTVDGKDLDSNALHLYNRSVETMVLSLGRRQAAGSDVTADNIKDAAHALHSHLFQLAEEDPRLRLSHQSVIDQLDRMANPKNREKGDDAGLAKEVEKLRGKAIEDDGVLAKELGVQEKEVDQWRQQLAKVVAAEKEVTAAPKLKEGDPKPKTGDKQADEYLSAFTAFLNSPITKKLLTSGGIKLSPKIAGAVGHTAAAVLGAVSLIDKWDSLTDKEKALKIGRLAVEVALAVQACLSTATAGVKMGVLLLLSYLLDFIDLGISLFPDGDGSKDGDGDDPGKNGAGSDKDKDKGGKDKDKDKDKDKGGKDKDKDGRGGFADAPVAPKGEKSDGKTLQEDREKAKKRYDEKADASAKESPEKRGEKIRQGKLTGGPDKPVDFKEDCKLKMVDPNDLKSAVAHYFYLRSLGLQVDGAPDKVINKAAEIEAERRRKIEAGIRKE